MKRGEVWLVNMEPSLGTEIKKIRPAVVVQNSRGLQNSPRAIVAPMTSQRTNDITIVEVLVPARNGLTKPSKILCNQLRSVDKRRMLRKLGTIPLGTSMQLNTALKVLFDLY